MEEGREKGEGKSLDGDSRSARGVGERTGGNLIISNFLFSFYIFIFLYFSSFSFFLVNIGRK